MAHKFSTEQLWLFLDDEAGVELRREINLALKDDPELAQSLQEMKALGDGYRSLPHLSFNDSDQNALLGRLRQEEARLSRPRYRMHYAAAAAAVFLIVGLSWGWSVLRGPGIGNWYDLDGEARVVRAAGRWSLELKKQTPFYRNDRIQLLSGQASLTLEDGSRIRLHAPAEFSCRTWNSTSREFDMPVGEALYEVESQPGRVFMVWVDNEPVTVTGTRFRVVAER
jgi:ferric-dicitrate binding protein FerR (iron transport regulator)